MNTTIEPIEDVYKQLVADLTEACKSLGWKFEARQDVDNLIHILIDDCNYFVSPTIGSTESFPLYYLGVFVPNPGTRWEPPSSDDKEISSGYQNPRQMLSVILEAHWKTRLDWAMQSTLTYGEE